MAKRNPCPVCKEGNVIPTSKRGFCAKCERVVQVIDYMVAQENKAAEEAAKRQLITPDDARRAARR